MSGSMDRPADTASFVRPVFDLMAPAGAAGVEASARPSQAPLEPGPAIHNETTARQTRAFATELDGFVRPARPRGRATGEAEDGVAGAERMASGHPLVPADDAAGGAAAALAAAAERGQHFGSLDTLNEDLIGTVRSMQEHVRMVSLPTDEEVRAALAENGFTLVGGLIKGTASDGMRAYVAVRGDDVVVVFRGTKVADSPLEMLANIRTDVDAGLEPADWFDPAAADIDVIQGARLHSGFSREWQSVRDEVYARINLHPEGRLWVFGHSLGAGLGTVAALDIAAHTDREVRFIGSGSPRVGDDRFRAAFERAVPMSLRVVVGDDVVARIPAVRDYEHVGRLLIADQEGHFMAPQDISTVPRIVSGWQPHDNGLYRTVSASLLEQTQASGDFLAPYQGILVEAADAERASHRPLRERMSGLAE